jgi:uracil-DNA glycosylase family 4
MIDSYDKNSEQLNQVVEESKQFDNVPTAWNGILFCGEAWGANEAKEKKPFCGRSGAMLNRLLLQAGIFRESCYITNVMHDQPKGNDFSQYYLDGAKRKVLSPVLSNAVEVLREKLLRLRPSVIIPLGEEPLKAVLGLEYKSISNWRGSILDFKSIPVVPTFHPAYLLRMGGWASVAFIEDLKRAIQVKNGKLEAKIPILKLCELADQLDIYFGTIAETIGYCAFDIETTTKGGEWIKCIGFACNNNEGVVIPFPQDIVTREHLNLQYVIRKWMTSGQIKWIGQNAYNFDIPYIERVWGFTVVNYVFDTMVAHSLIYPEFPHDLGTLVSFYTAIPYYKDISDKNLYQYNCNDVVATFTAAQKMMEELKAEKFADLHNNVYLPLLTPLRIMATKGLKIDTIYQKELKDGLKKEIKGLQKELDSYYTKYTNTSRLRLRLRRVQLFLADDRKTIKLWNPRTRRAVRKRKLSYVTQLESKIERKSSLNVNSPKELAKFLYEVLKLPIKTKNGKVTTDETALNQLYIKTQHQFLKTMLALRDKRNMLSRWGNLKTDDGRIYTYFAFTETGRLRSGRYEAK